MRQMTTNSNKPAAAKSSGKPTIVAPMAIIGNSRHDWTLEASTHS